jgi:hypothetical protein
MLVQMSHYEVYRSFASSFGFHEFSQDPTMVLALWLRLISQCSEIHAKSRTTKTSNNISASQTKSMDFI